MINYIQTNQDDLQDLHVITNRVWDKMVYLFSETTSTDDVYRITTYFREISSKYCIDPRTIIKQFLYYIVRNRSSEFVTTEVLNSIEHIIHLHHIRTEYVIHYFILKFRMYFQKSIDIPSPPVKKRIIKIKKKQSI